VFLAPPAGAAIFTVGPDGAHATVQAAVNAALFAGGDNEVRVQAGTYVQRVLVGSSLAAGSLTLTGGWDAAFAARDPDPLSTVLDGGGVGPVVDLRPSGGTLVLEGFTIRNGHDTIEGGGLLIGRGVSPVAATIVVRSNRIEGNSAADGGGIYVGGNGTPSLVVVDNVIRGNRALRIMGFGPRGAGLSVRALGEASFSVRGNLIESNEIVTSAETASFSSGGGVFLKLQENPFVDFSDNVVRDNVATGPGGNLGDGAAIFAFRGCVGLACTTGTIETRRNVFLDNRNESAGSIVRHLYLTSELGGTVRVTDSIVAGGSGEGIAYVARDGGTMQLTNLTVVEHPGSGIIEDRNSGVVSIANSILHDNNPDLAAPLAAGEANLVGIDPAFVDPAAADYRLQEGSPAIDAGSNTPPGGLGPFDVEGNSRVVNGVVDVGAVEFVPEPGVALLRVASGAALLVLARRRTRRPTA
jgi:hypothetical protein